MRYICILQERFLQVFLKDPGLGFQIFLVLITCYLCESVDDLCIEEMLLTHFGELAPKLLNIRRIFVMIQKNFELFIVNSSATSKILRLTYGPEEKEQQCYEKIMENLSKEPEKKREMHLFRFSFNYVSGELYINCFEIDEYMEFLQGVSASMQKISETKSQLAYEKPVFKTQRSGSHEFHTTDHSDEFSEPLLRKRRASVDLMETMEFGDVFHEKRTKHQLCQKQREFGQ
eukprot:TRINITY_DN4175_c0_g1_i1.p1 TRINITY_DN4175_c0_g1~~TRINITY_DN4175_c0_g1_i1.p1  ORF type:complete len:231 (+),score=37.02 TRINITY_DN4175_c0_g1_i1:386-1078(+)